MGCDKLSSENSSFFTEIDRASSYSFKTFPAPHRFSLSAFKNQPSYHLASALAHQYYTAQIEHQIGLTPCQRAHQ